MNRTVLALVALATLLGSGPIPPSSGAAEMDVFAVSWTIPQPVDARIPDQAFLLGVQIVEEPGHPGRIDRIRGQRRVAGVAVGPPVELGWQITRQAAAAQIRVGRHLPSVAWSARPGPAAALAARINAFRVLRGSGSIVATAVDPDSIPATADTSSWGVADPATIVEVWQRRPDGGSDLLDPHARVVTCGYWVAADGSRGPYAACDLT
jgi:hypothetical protein